MDVVCDDALESESECESECGMCDLLLVRLGSLRMRSRSCSAGRRIPQSDLHLHLHLYRPARYHQGALGCRSMIEVYIPFHLSHLNKISPLPFTDMSDERIHFLDVASSLPGTPTVYNLTQQR